MTINFRLTILVVLVALAFLLAGCHLNGPCDVPKEFDIQGVAGEWQAVYQDRAVTYPITGTLVISDTMPYLLAPDATPMPLTECAILPLDEPWTIWEWCSALYRDDGAIMNGTEILLINQNGTYRQFYISNNYVYVSPLNRWRFVDGQLDSPKLRMEGMKYFVEGIDRATGTSQMLLKPQVADLLRVQNVRDKIGQTQTAGGSGVIYPDFGYLYLYPRICKGKLSLVPMGWRVGDPDNMGISIPVFHKTR